ncbi:MULTISPECIES: hypothetical protein [Pseudomonas]|uniref:hypothetical protein n=1 Tax=Pseudomonas TaxID=286 RepID=UPI001BE8B1CF|nr:MULTISPECIES: hypothetical protein [Pseudomonas]MBT2339246.1 hypothetical protein [Pseudomonas fluorescens]MCD4528917.1 hypothetical protein [Pseudomonas sp. C3-2018]
MFRKILASLALLSTPIWAAPAPFTGTDYSGRYECTGMDSHIGEYKGVVEMAIDASQSTGKYGAYHFTLTLADNALYKGFAAGTSDAMAIYFAHTDPTLKDYGIGTAQFAPTLDGKTAFTKYYYGPEYEGGGHGLEYCVKG